MTHTLEWLKFNAVLRVNYLGHQTQATLNACLDDMAVQLDKATKPVMVLIDWRDVTKSEPKILLNARGHRAFNHPMAARGVLVGMSVIEKMQNEITAVKTRDGKNTQYYDTMEEAMDYLQYFLGDESLSG